MLPFTKVKKKPTTTKQLITVLDKGFGFNNALIASLDDMPSGFQRPPLRIHKAKVRIRPACFLIISDHF